MAPNSGSEVTVVFSTRNLSLQARLLSLLLLAVALSAGQTACDAAPTPTPATVAGDAESPRPGPAPTPTLIPTRGGGPPDSSSTAPILQATATPPAPTAVVEQTLAPPAATPTEARSTSVSVAPKGLGSLKTRMMSPEAIEEADLVDLTRGNTAFAFDLYRTLAQSDGDLFYSPYSVSLALAMTYAGAKGETEQQMADTLGFRVPQDRLHSAFNALDLALASRRAEPAGRDDGGIRLNIANAIWGQEGREFLTSFLDVLAEQYGSKVRRADFRGAPGESRARINEWVARETGDRIESLVPPGAIVPTTRLVLANAIYFKAAWESPFPKRATAAGFFHPLRGGQVQAPMMRQEGRFGYARGDGLQAVELLYDGAEMSMTILLPDQGTFRDFEGSLAVSAVDGILDDLGTRPVRLTMPKFEVEASFSLADALAAMGMPNAFDERAADFSGMDGTSCFAGHDECLLVTDVVHQAFLSVDEAGTEATAATAAVTGITRAAAEPVTLTIDRPFIFLVRDRTTDAVLFVGRVSELEQPG